MRGKKLSWYSIYDSNDALQYVGTKDECCTFLDMGVNTFNTIVQRTRKEKTKRAKLKIYLVED